MLSADVICLSEELIIEFVEARLPPDKLVSVDQHLDRCAECRTVVGALASAMPSLPHSELMPNAPTLGRYVVLEVVGEGAMGVVYAAYDPKLDRKVAIKVLHPEVAHQRSRTGPTRHDRFLREAKAMARLVHPNVVAVHDTGMASEQLFVAMEFVDGTTLREWNEAGPHSVAEVIEVYTQAGKGLVAAHGAGIVHRDFKPDNVLVSRAGLVKVGDFGLVSLSTEDASLDDDELQEERKHALDLVLSSGTMTQTGTRLGTARYMSPEQYDAKNTGPASDQYSFCVALYESLYGVIPFSGTTGREIRAAIAKQKCNESDTNAGALSPSGARLHSAVLLGLQEDPAKRHESMAALLTALATSQDRPKRRNRLLLGALAVGLTLSLLLLLSRNETQAPELCAPPVAELVGVWDLDVQSTLQAAFAANSSGIAAETSARVSTIFDAYRENWLGTHVQACQATRLQGHQSEHLLDLRVQCLAQKRSAFAASTVAFVENAANSEFLSVATSAALDMPAISECSNTNTLLSAQPRPQDRDDLALLVQLEVRLDKIEVQQKIGNLQESLPLLRALASDAEMLAFAPFQTRVLLQVAIAHSKLGEYEASDTSIPAVVRMAASAADDRAVADAWLLRFSNAVSRSKHDQAAELLPWVEAALLRAGEIPKQTAKLATSQAAILLRTGKYVEAQVQYQKVLALLEQDRSPDLQEVAVAHTNLAQAALLLNKTDLAYEEINEALTLQQALLGPNHPDLGGTWFQLCAAYHRHARLQEAKEACTRSLQIREKNMGKDHIGLAHPLNVLADIHRRKGRTRDARDLYMRALEIQEKGLDPMSSNIGTTLTNLGDLLSELGEYDQAHSMLTRSLEIRENTVGKDDQFYAIALHNLGNLAFARKNYKEALRLQDQALGVFEDGLGSAHPYCGYALSALGEVHLRMGKANKAVPTFRRALAIRETPPVDSHAMAQTQFLLAQSLTHPTMPRRGLQEARSLAQAAETALTDVGQGAEEELAELRHWRSSHR